MSNGEKVREFAIRINSLFKDEPFHIIGASLSMFLCALLAKSLEKGV